jgi:ubiquinone/menaquinone biosynthesis C-methylase UbiE
VTEQAPGRRSSAFTAVSVPENYDRYFGPFLFEPWARILLAIAGAKPGDELLDIASGTGVVTRLAARRVAPGGHVVAADFSEAMLAYASSRPAPSGAAPIEFIHGSAEALPLPGDRFDVVLCQQGLQFFPDRPGAAREMRRVLRPGGVASVSVWTAGRRLEPFDNYTEVLAEMGVEPPFPGAFERDTFALGGDELRTLFEDAGFASIDISSVERTIELESPESAIAGILGTPFGPIVDAMSPDRRRELDEQLARRFSPPGDGEPLRRATTAVIARAIA